MPKEWTHWILADACRKRLADGPLKSALEAQPDLYLLGSVLHDSPYYLSDRDSGKRVSDKLHGRFGYDTFRPFRVLSPRVFELDGMGQAGSVRCRDPRLAAVLAGALCHIAADTVFHPWVFYRTGSADTPGDDGRGRWLYRHRDFETALDQFLAGAIGRPAGERGVRILASVPGAVTAAAAFWSEVQPCDEKRAAAVLDRHGQLQGLFTSPSARLAAGATGLVSGSGTDKDPTALFYGRKSPYTFSLKESFSFRHPLTGEGVETTLEGLMEQVISRTLSWLAVLEEGNRGKGGSRGFPDPSLHLDTGLPASAGEVLGVFDPSLSGREDQS